VATTQEVWDYDTSSFRCNSCETSPYRQTERWCSNIDSNHIRCHDRNETFSIDWDKFLGRNRRDKSNLLVTYIDLWDDLLWFWPTRLTAQCIILTEKVLQHNVLLNVILCNFSHKLVRTHYSSAFYDPYWRPKTRLTFMARI
jgi:hypothetical protein